MTEASGENGTLSENAPGASGGESLAGAAARVLDNLAEMEPELLGAGIFDQNGEIVYSSQSSGWEETARQLIEALDAGSGEEKADSAHIASAEGEVFLVREAGLNLVAATGRLVLASLTTYDMRMALRDMAGLTEGPAVPDPADRAKNGGPSDA